MSEQNQITPPPNNQNQSGEPNNTQAGNPLDMIIQHKRLFLLFAAGLVALIISIMLLSLSFSRNTIPDDSSVTPSPSPSGNSLTTPTPNKTREAEEIKTQIKPALDQLIEVDYTISRVKVYDQIWALIQVTNPTTDPANLLLKKENGAWKVLLGPGTHFDDEELNKLGAPVEIQNDINFVGF